MIKSRLLPMLGVVAALVAGGCSSSSVKPPGSKPDKLKAGEYGRIQAVGKLDSVLLFGEPMVTAADGDQVMEIDVPVRSKVKKEAVLVQYRFEFFDENNRLLTRDERWAFQRLEPTLEFRLHGVGTHPAAKDWRLVVRPAE